MGAIRLLLAISVVIAHTSPIFEQKLWGGEIAVELFFIISGFYMALILNKKYDTSDKTVIFYKNRFLKLFPLYWTILVLTIILLISSYFVFNKGGTLEYIYNNMGDLGSFSIYIILTNIFILGQDLLMFLGFDGNNIIFTKSFADTLVPFHKFLIIPQSWTLGLEIMFYMLVPLIARKSIKLLLSLLLISVTIKVFLWYFGFLNDPWSYRFIASELSFFFIGMIIYRIYKLGIYQKIINSKSLFLGFYIAFISTGYLYYGANETMLFHGVDSFKYIIYFIFILFLPLLFEHTKNNKVDRFIGELSYPVYIVHIFVSYFIVKVSNDINLGLFVVIGSVILSITLNILIQQKIEKIRQKNILGGKLNDKYRKYKTTNSKSFNTSKS